MEKSRDALTPGYSVTRKKFREPGEEDKIFAGYGIVASCTSDVGEGWLPFPSIGTPPLYFGLLKNLRSELAHAAVPIIAQKRSVAHGGHTGIDSHTLTRTPWAAAVNPEVAGDAVPGDQVAGLSEAQPAHEDLTARSWAELIHIDPSITSGLLSKFISVANIRTGAVEIPSRPENLRPTRALIDALIDIGPGFSHPKDAPLPPVRIAVIDSDFDNCSALKAERVKGPEFYCSWEDERRNKTAQGFPQPATPTAGDLSWGHGTMMAFLALCIAPHAHIGLFALPLPSNARVYLPPTDLAALIAQAVEDWQADVVLIAESQPDWGTPWHLRETLRRAYTQGRGGKGTAIVTVSARPYIPNNDVVDSLALSADEFVAQPWVITVGACNPHGMFLRQLGHPLGRMSPSLTVSAPGYIIRLMAPNGAGASQQGTPKTDDTSAASALVGGALALCISANPELSMPELRHLLAMTAQRSDEVEEPYSERMLGAQDQNWYDQGGLNFKIGYGRLSVFGLYYAARDPICYALLFSRPRPDRMPWDITEIPQNFRPACLRLIPEWNKQIESNPHQLARRYVELRGVLARLMIGSEPLRQALAWVARHATAARDSDPGWPASHIDHGAFIDRLLYVVMEARAALSTLALDPQPGQAAGSRSSKADVHAWLALLEDCLEQDLVTGGQRCSTLLRNLFQGIKK